MTRDASIPVIIDVCLDAERIARGLDPDEMVEFIKQLDAAAQDWSVTLDLCEHFAALKIERSSAGRAS